MHYLSRCDSERLECPADSKRKDAGAGYKSFTENLMRFSDIDELPVKISLKRLDDGDGIEATLRCRKASNPVAASLMQLNWKGQKSAGLTISRSCWREIYTVSEKSKSRHKSCMSVL